MSSFVGHGLAAITVYVATELVILPDNPKAFRLSRNQLTWLGWLVIAASIPDLDYVVDSWNSSHHQGLRITHSVLFSLIAPCFTIFILLLKSQKVWRRGIQIILASLSHLTLDLLVGVTPLPLLFPLVEIPFKLPFGILPSAGRIDLHNYYFYRNLGLELGVLLPLLFIVCLMAMNRVLTNKNSYSFKFLGLTLTIALLICASYFIRQNLQLPR